ncbi:MAG: mechanosensitive ion channel family protein [Acidobacteriota bacterium]|nr:mechanosensitive ion channel family protein [Acidobacteriota bacterium]
MSEQIQSFLRRALALVGDDPRLQALAILVAFVVLAKIADLLITRVVKLWARRTDTNLDDRLIALLHRPLFISLVLVGLWLATTRLALDPTYEKLLLRLIKTLALVVWLLFVSRAGREVLKALSRLEGRLRFIEPRTVALLDNTLKVVVWGAGIYFFCLSWEIDVGGMLVTGGVLGLVLGLAAKDTLANLFAGVFILADAPYKVGDFVNLDSGERGEVTQIGLRSTRILTRDDIEVTVPNSVIANAKIINESGGPWEKERIRLKVGVAYGSDIDRVREILMATALAHPMIVESPEPRVRFRALGDSSLDFELLGWIEEPVLRGRVLDALYTEVYKRFQSEGVEIPYPKRDVYLHKVE